MKRSSHMQSSKGTASSRQRSGAVLYGTVLGTTLITSVLALAGLNIVRIERQQSRVAADRRESRDNARSAVELALKVIDNNPNWRSAYTNGVETAPISLGTGTGGTLSWILEDSDGSLLDNDVDLRLRGVGRVGQTTQVSSVAISLKPEILNSLLCSVYSVGNMSQQSNSTTQSGPFASAGVLTINGTVNGDVEGNPVVLSGSGLVTGTVFSPAQSRNMPLPSVWDTYTAIATSIPYSSFTVLNATTRGMSRQLLGATVNPFGATNPQGVYLIQVPAGQALRIDSSRVHGTLLIELGANSRFDLQSACIWDPYVGMNYPSMIVKGPASGSAVVELRGSNSSLHENSPPPSCNFNRVGEPYNGVTDADQSDQYTSLCRGLFHVIGSNVQTSLSNNLNLQGVVVCEGAVTLGSNLQVTVDPNIYSNPPLGYTGETHMTAVPGSWDWSVAP